MPRTVICESCGREFVPRTPRQRFCSRACAQERNKRHGPPADHFAEDWADPKVHRLVDQVIWRLRRRCPWLDRQEMLSHAWEAIWKARHRTERWGEGPRYAYYAKAVWLRLCGKLVPGSLPIGVSADAAQEGCDWSPLVDGTGATPPEQEQYVLARELIEHLRRIRGDRAVDELLSDAQGETAPSIGARYGVSRQAIQGSIERSRTLLKNLLEEEGKDDV